MGWVSPTGYEDPYGAWYDEWRAYNENTGNSACTTNPYDKNVYPPFLILTIDEITSDKLRLNLGNFEDYRIVDVDVYKDGEWVDVYEGDAYAPGWTEKTFTKGSVTKVRFRSKDARWENWARLFEFDFWEVSGVAHTKTVSEILGLTDSVSRVAAHKRTYSEILGLVDTWDKNKCKKCISAVIVVI